MIELSELAPRQLKQLVKQVRTETSIQLTAKIQSHCWPKGIIMPKAEVFARSEPAQVVDGDLYDFLDLKDGSYIYYVADVTGKGVPAGFIMAAIWSSFRSEYRDEKNLSRLVRRVNNNLFEFLAGEYHTATIILVRIWPEENRFEVLNCGHCRPLLVTGSDINEVKTPQNLPLGMVEKQRYESLNVEYEPSGGLLLFSDGVTETMDHNSELFGIENVVKLVQENGLERINEELFDKIIEWSKTNDYQDDTTLVGINFKDK